MATTTKPKPALRFTVRPFTKRKEYVVVLVWRSKADMLAHAKANHHSATDTTGAYCHTYDRWWFKNGERDRLMGDFAEVNFHLGQVTTETVTHELFHATIGLAYRLGILPKLMSHGTEDGLCGDAEEDCAYAHGRMCRLVTNRLHRAKVWH